MNPLLSVFGRRLSGMRLATILLIGCSVLSCVLAVIYLAQLSSLQVVELRVMDMILKAAPAQSGDSLVHLVEIDDASLSAYGQWPWPRYLLAELLERINGAEPAVVGLNMLFPERDRASPSAWQQTLLRQYGYRVDTSGIPEHYKDYDVFLAKMLKASPAVLGYKLRFTGLPAEDKSCYLQPVGLVSRLPNPALQLFEADDVVCNYRVLAESVDRSGFLNGAPDSDGVLRRLPLLIDWQQKTYPSFALAVLMEYLDREHLFLSRGPLQTSKLSLADLSILVDGRGSYIPGPLDLRDKVSISARDILQNRVEETVFKDRIVLVGLTASGLSPSFSTIFSSNASLLEIHRYSVESLLAESMVVRSPYFRLIETAATLLMVVMLVLAIVYLSPAWSLLIGAAGVVLVWLASIGIFTATGFFFSPLLPTMTLVGSYLLGLLLRFHFFQLEARREAETILYQLKSSRHSLQSILRTIPDIVFRLDQQARIVYISQAVGTYGRATETLLGKSIFDLVAPEDRPRVKNRIDERRTDSRSTRDLEITLDFSDEASGITGERRFFSLSSRGIYEDDRVQTSSFLGTQGILKDITEKKQLERELVQAQKMEVVGNLAAGIAHDLNNILSGLVSYPDLLLREVGPLSPLYDKIAIIQKSGKRAATIVQDLLTLARRNVNKAEVCNLNTIIGDYLDSLEFRQANSESDDIELVLDLDKGLRSIKGSAIHLSKLVMNVLQNSFEAMDGAGKIQVTTQNVCLEHAVQGYETIPPGEYVLLTVSDQGTGISEEDLLRVFEPFYTKKKLGRSGTGLGMSVIWTTIKDHDGYIDIDSRIGEGTTLRVYLLPTGEVVADSTAAHPRKQRGGNESILVVDDIPEQRNIVHSILSSVGYSVTTAASGEEAMAWVQDNQVDLVVLDMIMPGGWDGLETYRRLKEQLPSIKVIITSGYSESKRVDEIQRLGGGAYVQKPFSMETLLQAVRDELDGH